MVEASPSMLSSGGLTKPSTAPGGSRSHFMKLELARAELVAPSEPEQCRSKVQHHDHEEHFET
eukprot:1897985-Amphidinium_carterae.1